MKEKLDLDKCMVTNIQICYIDIEYLENAGIKTIQDILDYIDSGNYLYYIKGICRNTERAILDWISNHYDIKYPYKWMSNDDYLMLYHPNVWERWRKAVQCIMNDIPDILNVEMVKSNLQQRIRVRCRIAGFNKVGDLYSYVRFGGNLKDISGIGAVAEKAILDMFEHYGLNKPDDDLPPAVRLYLDHKKNWIRLCDLGLPHKVVFKFTKEGFSYVCQLRDYLEKGYLLSELLYEDGLTNDMELLCNFIRDKLYKNGVPYSLEVDDE